MAQDPDELFKKMMHEAKLAAGKEHPENDPDVEFKGFPSSDEANKMEEEIRNRLKEEYGDDVEISFRQFDTSDPEDRAELEEIFRSYAEDAEGDLMELPSDHEDAVDSLLDAVLGGDWTQAPEPKVGESFEDYLARTGLFTDQEPAPELGDDPTDAELDEFYKALGIETDWDPEVAGEGGFFFDERKADHGQNVRSDILSTAEVLVNGDRNAQYGDPKQDFARTAQMWSAYLGIEVAPHDVAAMMGLLKISRIRWSPNKKDHWVDGAGYFACGADCADDEFGGLV